MDLDSYSYHEAIDRTYILASIIEDHLSKHPVIRKHKKIRVKVKKAIDLLGEVYQEISDINES